MNDQVQVDLKVEISLLTSTSKVEIPLLTSTSKFASISTQCKIYFLARYRTNCVNGIEMVWAFCCSALYRATSRAIVVINAAGRAVAIKRNACLAVRQASACGVKGSFVLKFGIRRLASQHVSNKPGKIIQNINVDRWCTRHFVTIYPIVLCSHPDMVPKL